MSTQNERASMRAAATDELNTADTFTLVVGCAALMLLGSLIYTNVERTTTVSGRARFYVEP
jgi:hypothetical protein